MDKKHFSLITIAMIILLGVVGLGFMQLNTNASLNKISDRLDKIALQVASSSQQETLNEKSPATKLKTLTGYTTDFQLSYPENFSASLVESSMVAGQKDLRITSQSGELYLPGGGPAKPTSNEFTNGIQFYFYRLTAEDLRYEGDGSNQFKGTQNPLVTEILKRCDGVGCADRSFYIKAKGNVYSMEVRASNGYASTTEDINLIISSIKE